MLDRGVRPGAIRVKRQGQCVSREKLQDSSPASKLDRSSLARFHKVEHSVSYVCARRSAPERWCKPGRAARGHWRRMEAKSQIERDWVIDPRRGEYLQRGTEASPRVSLPCRLFQLVVRSYQRQGVRQYIRTPFSSIDLRSVEELTAIHGRLVVGWRYGNRAGSLANVAALVGGEHVDGVDPTVTGHAALVT